jgi:hypothetical protein
MPDHEHVPEPSADLSAVPAFLRERANPGLPAASRPLVVPRPVTPPPAVASPAPSPGIDPAALPMPSLSRRRLVTAAGIIAASLLALSFLRQVGEATDASNRADDLRAGNAALHAEVARLQRDLGRVQDPRYVLLAGRAYGLGGPREIPFALAAGAPPLAADAPGSASVRLGAPSAHHTPLEAWLEVLFGPRD